ncbi:MAG: hypothetical protein H8E55_06755 [Pelagibacterales bacterium]|nr:hypothetical protein [Pelagibacterales bacterium]
MKISFEITYNAGKLQKAMPKLIRNYLNDSIKSLEKGSKKAIMKGKFEPISEVTKFIREEGLSGNFGQRVSSSKPLKHSGRLYRSIKTKKKDKSLEFNEYGKYHLGMDKGETFDLTLDDSKKQFGSGSGEAYRIKRNKFTIWFDKTYNIDLAGKSVPIRDWLQFDESIKKLSEEFYKEMDKNFAK